MSESVAGAVVPPARSEPGLAIEVRRLGMPTMLSYGFGQVAEALKNAGFGAFLLFYYQQIVGLSGTLTATALAISLVLDAFCDPVAGALSDRLRSRWGRRHPYIALSAVPLAVSFYLLFNPPAGMGDLGHFVWLLSFAILARLALTCYQVPHLALGAEIAHDYSQRSTLYSFNVLFGSLGGAVGTALAYRAFFPTTQEFSPGLLNVAGYQQFSVAFGAAMIVAIAVCVLGTAREIPHLPVLARLHQRFSLLQVGREVMTAFRNPSFRTLFLGMMLATLMLAIEGVFAPYMGVHFWGLTTEQISLLPLVSVFGLIGSLLLIPPVTRWLDKKMTLIYTSLIAIFNGNVLICLHLVYPDLLPARGSSLLLALIAVTTFIGALMGPLIFATLNSMFADIADEHELETGERREGIIFAARSFAIKATSSLGLIIGGIVLDWIAFPRQARAGSVADDVLWNMGFITGPFTSLFVVIGVLMYLGYRLDRTRHAEILVELARRRG